MKCDRAHTETNIITPIKVAPQARMQRREASVRNELMLRCNKSLKKMKTVRNYQQIAK